LAQHEGGMHRDEAFDALAVRQRMAALAADSDAAPEDRLRGRGAERRYDTRLDERQLQLEPPAALLDLAHVRLLVDAALAARPVLEVFHRIGDVGLAALDSRVGESPVEDPPGGADEGMALQVLSVARLLADENGDRLFRALAEDGLGGIAVE